MVAANKTLAPYLPGPIVVKNGKEYRLEMPPKSIGRVKAFYGNFGILVRAYTYLLMTGANGLRRVAESAVLNANYLKALLKMYTPCPTGGTACMNSSRKHCGRGRSHPGHCKTPHRLRFPSSDHLFPPHCAGSAHDRATETESRETHDLYADALKKIAAEAAAQPELLHDAPHNAPVARLDEVMAARYPILCYRDNAHSQWPPFCRRPLRRSSLRFYSMSNMAAIRSVLLRRQPNFQGGKIAD